MDEANGSALDATAGGRNLANYGNPITSSTGKINSARAFPGSGGASLVGSSASDFSPGSNSFSFSFWVKLSAIAGGGYEGLLAKSVVGPSNVEWMVYRDSDNKLRFSVSSNGSTLSTVTWASALSTGTWYFVAGEWDGTNIKLSLNGATFQTTSFAGPIHSNTQPLDIGLIGGSGNPLDGNIDEVGIWMGRALTQTEVGQLYNGGAGLPFGSFGNGGTPTPTPTPTPSGLRTNLYAYYKMDEASGSALDATAGGRNLANYGNPITSSTGKINSARAFPGSGGASLVGSSASDFSPGSNSFSFSFWVKLSATAGGGYEGLLAKSVVGPSNVEWMVYRDSDNKLRFSVSSNGSTLSTVTWASALSTGTWYFVAGEWDGTNIKLSLNGATFQTTSFAGPIHSNTQPLDIGLIGGSGNPLDGNIDEVGIWMGRALTQTELGQLYNGGAGLPYSSF